MLNINIRFFLPFCLIWLLGETRWSFASLQIAFCRLGLCKVSLLCNSCCIDLLQAAAPQIAFFRLRPGRSWGTLH